MKFKKSFKNNEKKNVKKLPKALEVGGEKVKNISYFQLFRYSTGIEKLMILISIIGSLLQGSTLPLM